jgi:predicted ATPase/DNA-binding CsgD family transcriptional regulator
MPDPPAHSTLRDSPLSPNGRALNIPRPVTTMVGRDGEIATVKALVLRDDVQLVTLRGPGGVGKTRVAIEVLHRIEEAGFDTVVFVPLAAARRADLVPPAVAQVLGVSNTTEDPIMDRLTAYLRGRRTLIVLDNLEHLPDAGPFVADLIARCPSLTVLCTSRSRLNLSGEHVYPVPPLSVEASVALFAQRTTALSPGFTLTQDLSPMVEAICDHVDRLPLAIELAAARSPVLSPGALLERLRHPLALLTGGPRDAPDRQRTMRNVIAWSYDLLPDDDQMLYRRLGVFIGGFTLEAAEAVAGDGGDVLPGLESLITSSLVQPAPEVGGQPRFTMLETIREFALEQLAESGEEPETRQRHAGYYQWLAEDALPRYDGPEVRLASERVDIELNNCRAALAWAVEAQAAETGIRLAGALWHIWALPSAAGGKPWVDYPAEGLAWIERMLPMREGLPVEALTEALVGAGALAYFLRGDIETVRDVGQELLTRARAEGYPYGEYWALAMLGGAAHRAGDLAAARGCFAGALALAPAVRNPDNQASIVLHWLGELELGAGDAGAAARHLGEALRLSHSTGNTWIIADASDDLGRALHAQGQLGRAATLMREGLLAFAELRRVFEVHASLVNISRVALDTGQPVRAARLLGVAATFPTHPKDMALSANAMAQVRAHMGDAAFTAALEDGRRFAWEQALAEVDALVEAVAEAEVSAAPKPGGEYRLTRREREVLLLLVEGRSNREIAEALYIGRRTVTTHVTNILAKFGVETRAAAVSVAYRRGLV